jgi:cobalt-zinc-cadmium efflux system protein
MECTRPDVKGARRQPRHAHHDHSHDHPQDGNRLMWALVLTGGFAVVEIVSSFLADSLTLFADGGHMLTDAAALALAWVALRFAARPSDRRRTYGYQRLQVLAAFVNSILLLLAVAWIIYEAIQRLRTPTPVGGPLMLAVAVGGLLVNVAALTLLRRGDAENLNLRAAYLHVLADLLGSLAAMVAASVIILAGWTRVDPLLALLVAALIVFSAGSLLVKSAHILLEGSPEWLDIAELEQELRIAVGGVVDVHHVHVWSLTSRHPLLSLHARIQPDAAPAIVLQDIKAFLSRRYALEHSTIQLEASDCPDG